MGKHLIIGAGDIGTRLSRQLEEPIGVSRTASKEFRGQVVSADITERTPVNLSRFETVYHLATHNSGEKGFEEDLPEVQGSRNLVEKLEKAENSPRLVYASSFSAIGVEPGGSKLSYPEAKRMGEKICREYERTRIIRLGNVYGDGKGVVDTFIRSAREKGRVTVHGDGDQKRPFISIRDAARALKDFEGEVVNAYERVYTVGEVAEKVAQVFNADIVLKKGVETSDFKLCPSNFQTRYTLEDYIKDEN
ncbi:MAG: NAD-dependent epimerase/dehydratase family protein [Candidatus Nanohaloarchaea archaeon]